MKSHQSGAIYRDAQGFITLGLGLVPGARTFPYLEFPPFFYKKEGAEREASTFGFREVLQFSSEEFQAFLEKEWQSKTTFCDSEFQKAPWQEPNLRPFQDQFERAQVKFKTGELQKIVPIVFSHANKTPQSMDLPWLLERLTRTPPSHRVFGMWTESQGVLGATPEVLYRREDNSFYLMALAGTRGLEDARLSESQKDLLEHQAVIRGIRERALPFLGVPRQSETREVTFGAVVHLMTELVFDFENETNSRPSWMDIFHPTAALGGYPLESAYDSLFRIEQSIGRERRHRFGAPFVWHQDSNFEEGLVAIRCLDWSENQSRIGSGCGVLPSSELVKEWRELSLKRKFVRDLFGLSPSETPFENSSGGLRAETEIDLDGL